jgi:hypothetical protein
MKKVITLSIGELAGGGFVVLHPETSTPMMAFSTFGEVKDWAQTTLRGAFSETPKEMAGRFAPTPDGDLGPIDKGLQPSPRTASVWPFRKVSR